MPVVGLSRTALRARTSGSRRRASARVMKWVGTPMDLVNS